MARTVDHKKEIVADGGVRNALRKIHRQTGFSQDSRMEHGASLVVVRFRAADGLDHASRARPRPRQDPDPKSRAETSEAVRVSRGACHEECDRRRAVAVITGGWS